MLFFGFLPLLQFMFTLEGILGSVFGSSACYIFLFYAFGCFRSSMYPFFEGALTVCLAYEKAPGPSEAEGAWLILGGRPFAPVAERPGAWCSQRILVFFVFHLCPLIIDQVWSSGSDGITGGQVGCGYAGWYRYEVRSGWERYCKRG